MDKQIRESEFEIMDFAGIDLTNIRINSKNVFGYYTSSVKYDYQNIDSFISKKFKIYAEKHNIEFKEVYKLFRDGVKIGKAFAKNNITEKSLISSEGGKNYLFDVATVYNLTAKYVNGRNQEYFRSHCATKHNPEVIKKIGMIIGEFFYSWEEIFKNHRVFEPLFEREVQKIIDNDPFNILLFPYKKSNVIGLPETMKIFQMFWVSIIKTNRILLARRDELLDKRMNEPTMNHFFRYNEFGYYKKQCFDFIQETTNNMDNGVFIKHNYKYNILLNDLNECISTLESLKPIFNYDMSFMNNYSVYNDNWFNLAHEMLISTRKHYLKITYIEGLSQRFDCSLSKVKLTEVHQVMIDMKYIQADISDFLKVFGKEDGNIEKPVKWLLSHNGKANKTSLFTFLKMMLELDKVPRDMLNKANELFKPNNIFFSMAYPSKKEQQASLVKYFKSIKHIITNTRP